MIRIFACTHLFCYMFSYLAILCTEALQSGAVKVALAHQHCPGLTKHLTVQFMPVRSLPEDKPKIVFHAAMMVIQNFGFFTMYFDAWGASPKAETCEAPFINDSISKSTSSSMRRA